MISDNTITLTVISLLVVAISITLHEFTHGLASNLLGDDTAKQSGRLTLNPLKHIDIFTTVLLPVILVIAGLPPFGAAKPVPFNPNRLKFGEFGAAIVGAAGPLSNFLLAVIGGLILRFTGTMNSNVWVTWWWLFIVINIGFFVFNLIPFPPLDGSRVLYAFSPEFLQNILARLESLGFMAVIIFMLFLFPVVSPLLQRVDNWLVMFLVGF